MNERLCWQEFRVVIFKRQNESKNQLHGRFWFGAKSFIFIAGAVLLRKMPVTFFHMPLY